MNLHKESDQTNVKTNDLYGSFAHALLHQYFFLLALILFIVTVSTHKVSRNTGPKKPQAKTKQNTFHQAYWIFKLSIVYLSYQFSITWMIYSLLLASFTVLHSLVLWWNVRTFYLEMSHAFTTLHLPLQVWFQLLYQSWDSYSQLIISPLKLIKRGGCF